MYTNSKPSPAANRWANVVFEHQMLSQAHRVITNNDVPEQLSVWLSNPVLIQLYNISILRDVPFEDLITEASVTWLHRQPEHKLAVHIQKHTDCLDLRLTGADESPNQNGTAPDVDVLPIIESSFGSPLPETVIVAVTPDTKIIAAVAVTEAQVTLAPARVTTEPTESLLPDKPPVKLRSQVTNFFDWSESKPLLDTSKLIMPATALVSEPILEPTIETVVEPSTEPTDLVYDQTQTATDDAEELDDLSGVSSYQDVVGRICDKSLAHLSYVVIEQDLRWPLETDFWTWAEMTAAVGIGVELGQHLKRINKPADHLKLPLWSFKKGCSLAYRRLHPDFAAQLRDLVNRSVI